MVNALNPLLYPFIKRISKIFSFKGLMAMANLTTDGWCVGWIIAMECWILFFFLFHTILDERIFVKRKLPLSFRYKLYSVFFSMKFNFNVYIFVGFVTIISLFSLHFFDNSLLLLIRWIVPIFLIIFSSDNKHKFNDFNAVHHSTHIPHFYLFLHMMSQFNTIQYKPYIGQDRQYF